MGFFIWRERFDSEEGWLVPTTVNPSLKALVTLTEAQNYMNYQNASLTDAQNDALLRLINGVSEAIANDCRVPLIKAAATEYYTGGARKIILERAPVDRAEAVTVVEAGTTLYPPVRGTLYTSTGASPGYYLHADEGMIERASGYWDDGFEVIAVTYTAGRGWQYKAAGEKRMAVTEALSSTDIPDDLREAALIILKAHSDLGPTSWGAQVLPGGEYMRPSAWPLAARLMLNAYRMPRM